jgi:hypothetical protein
VSVVAMRGRGVAVPQSMLSLEQIAPTDQLGGHRMPQAVKADIVQSCFVPKLSEPVPQATSRYGLMLISHSRAARKQSVGSAVDLTGDYSVIN